MTIENNMKKMAEAAEAQFRIANALESLVEILSNTPVWSGFDPAKEGSEKTVLNGMPPVVRDQILDQYAEEKKVETPEPPNSPKAKKKAAPKPPKVEEKPAEEPVQEQHMSKEELNSALVAEAGRIGVAGGDAIRKILNDDYGAAGVRDLEPAQYNEVLDAVKAVSGV